jgi:hypothetical protein
LLHNGGTADDIEAALDAIHSDDEDEQHDATQDASSESNE